MKIRRIRGLSLSHALHCPACGLFGRRARRRAREADEALLVNFHRHQARLAKAARRQAWLDRLDSLPDDLPPWQVHVMEALAHDLALYFGPGGDGGTLVAMPYQHPQHRPLPNGWRP